MHFTTTLALLASAVSVSVAEFNYRLPPVVRRQAVGTGAPFFPTGTGTGIINPIFPTGGPTAVPGGLFPNITTTLKVIVSPLPIPVPTYGFPPSSKGNDASPTGGAGGDDDDAGSGDQNGSGSNDGSGAGDSSYNTTRPEEYTGAAMYIQPSGWSPYISTLAGLALFAIVA